MIKVVGTMFFEDNKLLLDKPRKRHTYQMIGGSVEEGESSIEAAIRECHEELGNDAIFDESLLELVWNLMKLLLLMVLHLFIFMYLNIMVNYLVN